MPHGDETSSQLCALQEEASLPNCIASLVFHVVLLAAAADVEVCWHRPSEPALGDSQLHTCSNSDKILLDLDFQRHGPLLKDLPS